MAGLVAGWGRNVEVGSRCMRWYSHLYVGDRAKKYRYEDYLVVGIAVTYWEALEVVGRIVDDLYRQTGDFCLDSLIGDVEE